MEEAGIINYNDDGDDENTNDDHTSQKRVFQVNANLFVFSSNFWTENAKSMKSALSVLPCRNGLVILP